MTSFRGHSFGELYTRSGEEVQKLPVRKLPQQRQQDATSARLGNRRVNAFDAGGTISELYVF